jgi:hypothetical protein
MSLNERTGPPDDCTSRALSDNLIMTVAAGSGGRDLAYGPFVLLGALGASVLTA